MSELLTNKQVRDMAQKCLDEVNERIDFHNRMHNMAIAKLMKRLALFETVIDTTGLG